MATLVLKKNILIGVFALASLLLYLNHFVINWQSIISQKANISIEQLIKEQKKDLNHWIENVSDDKDFHKRAYKNNQIEAWNSDEAMTDADFLDAIVVIQNDFGIQLIQTKQTDHQRFISSYALVRTYPIQNQNFSMQKGERLSPHINDIKLSNEPSSRHTLFDYTLIVKPNQVIDTIAILLIGICFTILYFRLIQRKKIWVGVAILIALRGLSVYFNVLPSLLQYDFFNPLYFSSGAINPTLGDFLINLCVLLCLVFAILKWLPKKLPLWSKWVGTLVSTLSIISVYLVTDILLEHSHIILDIGKTLQMDSLRLCAFLCLIVIGVAHTLILIKSIQVFEEKDKATLLVFGIAISFISFIFFGEILTMIVTMHTLVMLLTIARKWIPNIVDYHHTTLLFILLSSICLSFAICLGIYTAQNKEILNEKVKFSNYILLKIDVVREFELIQKMDQISNDALVNRLLKENKKDEVRAAIRSVFTSELIDHNILRIVFEDEEDTKKEWVQLEESSSYANNNIYFSEKGNRYKYSCVVQIGKKDALLIFEINKFLSSSFYPKLFENQNYFTVPNKYDYLVMQNGKTIFTQSKFGQIKSLSPDKLKNEQLFTEGIVQGNSHFYGIKAADDKLILIVSKHYTWYDALTSFCWFILLYFFVLSCLISSYALRKKHRKINFTNKIQLYLGLSFIVPFLIAGVTLLSVLYNSYQDEIERGYLKKALNIAGTLSDDLQTNNLEDLQSNVAQIRNINQTDLDIYDSKGHLIIASQKKIFLLNLKSKLLDPAVMQLLSSKNNKTIILDKTIGNIDYKVCYSVIVDRFDEAILGFISIPFLDSKNHQRRQQQESFATLTIVFCTIFILTILFSNIVLSNLLHPLKIVANRIRQLTLQEINQPLEYSASDIIGSLVKDYNHMLMKLEKSKQTLAKTQKETAWKEIAQQVAHEIKNPLTPMSLKIQRMLQNSKLEQTDKRNLESLLHQIHTLSEIAESFSTFAKMPVPNNTAFDFSVLVKEVIKLYQSKGNTFHVDVVSCEINTDRDIFRGILNNIILNAIQAAKDLPIIYITLKRLNNKCELAIKDNGQGIDMEVQNKIFTPYFSTKSSGSGIGLVLAKKGIEHAGGNIWFTSDKDKGTTFFISMPLASS